jgi:acetyl-CoA C-acetyltransferase
VPAEPGRQALNRRARAAAETRILKRLFRPIFGGSAVARSVLVAGARTPIGKLSGALSSFTAQELGGFAIAAALERAGIAGDQVDYVIMGQVIGAGQGQITARQAAVKGGIPMNVPAITINKVCLSGLDAIALADQLIRAGEFEIIVAGGMESMSQAPYLLPKARTGYRYGNGEILDATYNDALLDAFDQEPMGESTDKKNKRFDIDDRAAQDEFAARSHELAAAAIKSGRFADEITPVAVPQRKGDPILVSEDEGVRPETTVESLSKLKPAFVAGGTITAGNASQISDGGCAVVVMSAAKAQELGVPILAEIGAHGVVAGPDNSLHAQPADAIAKALARENLSAADLDLVEINEAFAAVGIASSRKLGLDPDKVNVNGGAIALGHPVGMSGARVVLTLAYELKRRGGGVGAAALCGGGGQGDALILHVPA